MLMSWGPLTGPGGGPSCSLQPSLKPTWEDSGWEKAKRATNVVYVFRRDVTEDAVSWPTPSVPRDPLPVYFKKEGFLFLLLNTVQKFSSKTDIFIHSQKLQIWKIENLWVGDLPALWKTRGFGGWEAASVLIRILFVWASVSFLLSTLAGCWEKYISVTKMEERCLCSRSEGRSLQHVTHPACITFTGYLTFTSKIESKAALVHWHVCVALVLIEENVAECHELHYNSAMKWHELMSVYKYRNNKITSTRSKN